MQTILKLLLIAGLTALPQSWAQGLPAGAAAQSGHGGISLQQALMIALEKNPSLQISASNVAANQGALQTASGFFDPLLNAQTTVEEMRDTARSTSSSVDVSRQLRSGVVLGLGLSGQSRNAFDSSPVLSTAAVGVNITFPLFRGRGEAYAAAAETAAGLMLEKSQYDLRHTTSLQILSTAVAYWNLRAAEEALAAQREAEERAERMVADIGSLIRAGERPAADISIINANLTGKRAARIAAEQVLTQARMALGRELGLDYTELRAITSAVDAFPAFSGDPPLIESAWPLVALGFDRRFDLKAANVHLDALRVALNSARDNLQPVLDLSVGVSYGGSTAGESPWQVFGRKAGEPQVSATLKYTWDVANNTSKGRLLSQSTVYDQQTVSVRALRLAIGTGIENAVAVYNRSARQLVESQYTVDLYTKIVEDEKKKLQMGSSTLLDVVNVESQRQDAVISNITQRLAYANAIAALRFELGDLIGDEARAHVLLIDRLLMMGRHIGAAP